MHHVRWLLAIALTGLTFFSCVALASAYSTPYYGYHAVAAPGSSWNGVQVSMTTQSCRSVTIQRCRSRTATSPPLQALSCSVPPPLSWSRRPRSRHEGPLMVSTSALCSSRSRIAAASASSPNSGAHSAMLLFEVMSIEP